MHIQFLGTGAGMPSKTRNVSSLALKLLEEIGSIWLFDCGEATQHQILHTTVKPRKIDKIFITHLHGDHIYGLPGLLGSRSFLGGDQPLTIYGPKGLKEWIELTLQTSQTHLNYAIEYVEVGEGIVLEDENFIVTAMPLEHVVPCFGYRIEQKPLLGTLQVEKAIALGVPKGPLLGQLKNGHNVTLEDGTIVRSVDVTDEPKKGFTVAILGDTRYCENAIKLSENADIVVHESTFDHSTSNLAASYGHSTNMDAANVAFNAGAKNLLLNHLSARFFPQDIEIMLNEAKKIIPNTFLVTDFDEFKWIHEKLERI
ncbi:ribonuclease Z [Rummeliibacillus sp. TYF005]|uniref:ribonuclease Z n=1 Tax=Rummeliibacillus sp. TYF005 TaxID=2058214 RepID=UPI000F540B05|nr:ribonuclease Z [Rummeliibacillus sp. TYF005]RPJ96132.1 ribonuclease Z [Rummeliibacillus sp. TYF005]